MSQTFTSKDVIKMSIQAKEKGVELYLALAKNSSNYYVGKLFVELAKDEQRHKHELEKWLAKLKDEGREEAYPGEKSLFLKALVSDNAFNCDEACKKMLETTISEEEALRAGINFEKDFMLFLHELKRHVPENDSAVIDKLIDEEIDHIREIIKIKDKLEKK